MSTISLDTSLLVDYYNARINTRLASSSSSSGKSSQTDSSQIPPWSKSSDPDEVQDKNALSSDAYFDEDNQNLKSAESSDDSSGSLLESIVKKSLSKSSTSSSSDPSVEQDNEKLFALYQAVERLARLADIATRDETVSGQLPGLDTRLQEGLAEITSFVDDTDFANLTVLSSDKVSSVTGTAVVSHSASTYEGSAVVEHESLFEAVPGVSSTDSFTISVTKGGTTTDVEIDLSQISGTLSLDAIADYANEQLEAQGFTTRLKRTQTGGSIADDTATWGLSVTQMGAEKVSLSSSQAEPALYVSGTSGTGDEAQGRIIKIADLDSDPSALYSASVEADDGSSTAKASVTDADGNVYVLGNTDGDFGGEINQASQDVYLTKYDSAGNVQWTKLLGSASSASGYALAADPNGGVVVVGSTTSDLDQGSIGGGTDSFAAKYDSQGNQSWLRQIDPVSDDSALAVTVADDGSIYIGGQTKGTIASGQTNAGGTDAYITKLDSNGALVYQRQFGTSGTDAATQMAIADDGNLVVASVQDGHAILTKYDSANGTDEALWQIDLGDLNGGSLGGLVVENGQVYLSGTTSNTALDAGGEASIVTASTGNWDAFVFSVTDAGSTATPDYVTYVGTDGTDRGAGLAVSNGKIYLTGSTTGTFDGQSRNVENANNLFVAQIDESGTVDWTRQYGGVEGQSQGASISVDTEGSSVLDSLGLPRGTIDLNQSSDLSSQTTLRAGDYFTMKVTDETGTHSMRVTIEEGETMRSLAKKIDRLLGKDGEASSTYASGGSALKIEVSAGVQIELIAGDTDSDALAGLGISPGLLIKDAEESSSDTSTSSSKTDEENTIGLGLDQELSLETQEDAEHTYNALQAILSLIKQAYQTLNTQDSSDSTSSTSSGQAPAYLQSQINSYQTALTLLGG